MFETNGQSQVDIIRQIIMSGGTITQEQAYDYGIMRLASRIYDLKRAGFGICSNRREVKNRYGEERKIAEYYMQKEDIKNAKNI